MSFVFSAANQEDKRQNETEKRKAESIEQNLSTGTAQYYRVQATAWQEQHTHPCSEQVYVDSWEKKKKIQNQTTITM